jgi:hypothetical protein
VPSNPALGSAVPAVPVPGRIGAERRYRGVPAWVRRDAVSDARRRRACSRRQPSGRGYGQAAKSVAPEEYMYGRRRGARICRYRYSRELLEL